MIPGTSNAGDGVVFRREYTCFGGPLFLACYCLVTYAGLGNGCFSSGLGGFLSVGVSIDLGSGCLNTSKYYRERRRASSLRVRKALVLVRIPGQVWDFVGAAGHDAFEHVSPLGVAVDVDDGKTLRNLAAAVEVPQ